MKSKDLETHDSVFVARSFFKVPNDVLHFLFTRLQIYSVNSLGEFGISS